MPIKYTGNQVCQNCHKSFEWTFFEMIRQKISSPNIIIEDIPNKTLVHYFRKVDNHYDVSVNCPHCDYDNIFIFKEDDQHD